MMYKTNSMIASSLHINEALEGETIETKVFRALTNEEGIESDVGIIYTERKDGVLPEYNPRTDKWEIAIDAMSKVDADNKVRRLENIKAREPKSETGEGESGA